MKLKEIDSGVYGEGKDIIFANDSYYMLSASPAKVCISKDLKKWTEIELNSDYLKPESLAYGNGLFVITGSRGTTTKTYIYTSTDGVNWTPQIINTGKNFSITSNSCKFINNRFIFLSGIYYYNATTNETTKTENWFFESTNAKNWKKHILTINGSDNYSQMDITYKNGLYVRVGSNGSIYTSSNLDNWIKRDSTVKDKLVGITYGKGLFVVTGDNGTILTSTNGTNWQKQDSTVKHYLIRSRYANGMYIAVGYNGTILQSLDGTNWKNISTNKTGVRYGLAYGNELFIVTGNYYSKNHHIPIIYFEASRQIAESTDDSSLFFFDTELNLKGIIDSFISLRWRRKYYEAGEFEIVLPSSSYILSLISENTIIMRNNYTEAGIIETIEYSEKTEESSQVTISGRFLTAILERRIIKSTLNFKGNTIEGMNTIIEKMTPFTTNWETVASSISSKYIEFQATYKNVYDYLCRLSEFADIGFRLVPNVESKVFLFEAWKGKNRTSNQTENEQYTFSSDNENIEQSSLLTSDKTKANYILVGGAGEGENRILEEIKTEKTGFELYEVFSDQKSVSSDGLSTSEYKNQLKDIGNSLVCDGIIQFEATAINIGDYKTKWDLGDIVNIEKSDWKQMTTKRIIEVEETIEDGTKSIIPTLGDLITTNWKDE